MLGLFMHAIITLSAYKSISSIIQSGNKYYNKSSRQIHDVIYIYKKINRGKKEASLIFFFSCRFPPSQGFQWRRRLYGCSRRRRSSPVPQQRWLLLPMPSRTRASAVPTFASSNPPSMSPLRSSPTSNHSRLIRVRANLST